MIARKLHTAFTHRLIPILCVGDSLDEHRTGQSEVAVRTQLEVLLRVYHLPGGPFLVAYEPAWAIRPAKTLRNAGPTKQQNGTASSGLIGGASQDPTSFQALIDATITTYQRPQPGRGQ